MSCYVQTPTDLSLEAAFDRFLFSGAFSSFSDPNQNNNIIESQPLYLPTLSSSASQSIITSHPISYPAHEAAVDENSVPLQSSSFNCFESSKPLDVPAFVTYEELFEVLSWKTPGCPTPTRTPRLTSESLVDQSYHQTPLQALQTNSTLVGPSVISKSSKTKVKARSSGKVRRQSIKNFQTPEPKLFKCGLDSNCDKMFARAEHLARHERKHTKEKPFTCHCAKSFSRLDNWRQHKVSLHKDEVEENERTEKRLVEVHRDISRRTNARQPTVVAGFFLPPTSASASSVSSTLLNPQSTLLQPRSLSGCDSASLEDVDLFTVFSGYGRQIGEPETSSSVFPASTGSAMGPCQLPASAYPTLADISQTILYPSQSTTAYGTSGAGSQYVISPRLLEPFSFPNLSSHQPSELHTYETFTVPSGYGHPSDSTSHLLSPITQIGRRPDVAERWAEMAKPRIHAYPSVVPSAQQVTSSGAPTFLDPFQYQPVPHQAVPFSTTIGYPEPSIEASDLLSFLNHVITPTG